MKEIEVFELADRALVHVVSQIRPDQWEMVMPPTFATTAKGEMTLRAVVAYHAYEDAWVPDMVAGRAMDEVGVDAYKADLLGEDPASAFAAIVEQAIGAVRAVTDPQQSVHCSFGDFTTQEYLWQTNSFRGLRAHDIAKVIGVDVTLPDALVEGLWEELEPVADQWRQWNVFPAAIPVPSDAPLLDRLLGLTGRQPDGVTA